MTKEEIKEINKDTDLGQLEKDREIERQKTKDKTEQITRLKVEIFDIMMQQEILNNQINQLQNIKIQKLQELQNIENKLKS